MKAVILAGGLGTRLSEETVVKPKPMVEIGGKPILWHIMKIYSHYGINDFIICLGYKGYMIKEYFANYYLHQSDVTFDMKNDKMMIHNNHCEPWSVTLVDTGEDSMTGGRLKRVRKYVDDETFCFTYGDGVSNVNINDLIEFHNSNKKNGIAATLTAVNPPARFGMLELNCVKVLDFKEKPQTESGWINGGFFVLEPEVFNFIEDDSTIWEREPIMRLVQEGKMAAFKHTGFWQPMDTLREKRLLEELWDSGQSPWKVW